MRVRVSARAYKKRGPMSCYRPIIIKNPATQKNLNPQQMVPCGRCIGCKLDYSRMWAVRCMHEAKMHKHNCFVTLTYDEDCVPKTKNGENTLRFYDIQTFIKRLRKAKGEGIRYFQCGEYGEKQDRPHYHLCLFNCEFSDKYFYRFNRLSRNIVSKNGNDPLFRSSGLEDIWTYGISSIGELTFESAAYVARYCTKKISGAISEEHYGERETEKATMSRKPGIGYGFFNRFYGDIYNTDTVFMPDGKGRTKPPRFYDEKFLEIDEEKMQEFKERRIENGLKKFSQDSFISDLRREEKHKRTICNNSLKRNMEKGDKNGGIHNS